MQALALFLGLDLVLERGALAHEHHPVAVDLDKATRHHQVVRLALGHEAQHARAQDAQEGSVAGQHVDLTLPGGDDDVVGLANNHFAIGSHDVELHGHPQAARSDGN